MAVGGSAQSENAEPAHWLVHRYDETADQLHLLNVPRDIHRSSAFLTDEYLPADLEKRIAPRAEVVAAQGSDAPVHFIFHSGFCCSTMLTRAFDVEGTSMGLKEPMLLRDVVGFLERGATGDDTSRLIDDSLRLLANPIAEGEINIVKPSCTVNVIAGRIMERGAHSNAIFLYAPLRVFLGSIARKQLTGRLWARELFLRLQQGGLIDLGFTPEQLFGQSDLQIAALAWLAQNIAFARLAAKLGPKRLSMLDSETFLGDPASTLSAISRHFNLALSRDQIAAIIQGPAFTEHSKFGTDFDADQRKSERLSGDTLHADEIEKVALWAEVVAKGMGASMIPGPSILS